MRRVQYYRLICIDCLDSNGIAVSHEEQRALLIVGIRAPGTGEGQLLRHLSSAWNERSGCTGLFSRFVCVPLCALRTLVCVELVTGKRVRIRFKVQLANSKCRDWLWLQGKRFKRLKLERLFCFLWVVFLFLHRKEK